MIYCFGAFRVERFESFEERSGSFPREFFAECGVGWDSGERLIVDERLDPESRPAADDGEFAAICDIFDRRSCIAEEMRDIVLFARIGDVEEVMWHERLLFFGYLAGSDIHAAVDLPAVGGNNLAIPFLCYLNRERRLS